MSSGWLPKHRQLFFQILEEGLNAENKSNKHRDGRSGMLGPLNFSYLNEIH